MKLKQILLGCAAALALILVYTVEPLFAAAENPCAPSAVTSCGESPLCEIEGEMRWECRNGMGFCSTESCD